MRLYLGVDGGQSSTTALIGDETGRVLGTGHGGPCNHVAAEHQRAKFLSAIGGCIADACEKAGLCPSGVEFESACFGFSGGAADKHALVGEVARAKKLSVTDDASIALSGALAGGPGVVTIAGTGSICFGRNQAGKVGRAGGWGYIFGDEGSAFDIARQAVRAALRLEEGWGPPTSLYDLLLEETNVLDANQLLHLLYTNEYPRARTARIAKLVDLAAQSGDSVAAGILMGAAQQLASLAVSVQKQLFEGASAVQIAYVGGVFRSSLLLERFRTLLELDNATSVIPPMYGPAAGALLEAYRTAGMAVSLRGLPENEKA